MEQDIGHKTISEAVGADHQYMDLCFDTLRAAKSLDEQVRWRNQLTWTFARHAISEELTWYPEMEKLFGEKGVKMAETDREQHQAVRGFLFGLWDVVSGSVSAVVRPEQEEDSGGGVRRSQGTQC